MEEKPKGRARGRARGNVPTSPAVPTPGAVGSQNVPVARTQARPGGLQERRVQADPVERVRERMANVRVDPSGNGNGNGNGNGSGSGAPLGRGVTRGKREIPSIKWTRPEELDSKVGKTGDAVDLVTNYFLLQKKKNWSLCLYHVDITPEEDRTGVKKKLLHIHDNLIGEKFIFDGMQLYSSRRMQDKVTLLQSKLPDIETIFQVKLTFIKELAPLDSQYIQILNILLRRCQGHLGLTLLGRNFYDSALERIKDVRGERLRVWPGYTTSIRQHENDILLNVDVTHKFLRANSALEEMIRLMQQERSYDKILGSIVMTTYNHKTYRIDDINRSQTPLSKFHYKDKDISYLEYYETRYQVKIRDVKQPLIMSRPKPRDVRRGMATDIYLIPELCTMTGLSDEIRNNRSTMRELVGFMKMSPDVRCQTLKNFNTSLFNNPKVTEELNNWGLTLDRRLVKVNGRVVPEERITQGGKTFSYQRHSSDWSREMRSLSLNSPCQLQNWTYIFPARIESDAKALLSGIIRVAGPMGMQVAQPQLVSLSRDGVPDYSRELKSCAGKQLVMCLLMNNNADKYSAIKKICTVNLAIPSQCVLLRTAKAKSLLSVASKIAIQINCKLGGEVWNLQIPIKNTMIIGYDAYHDSVSKGSSYGAVVSSLNQNWTKYHAQVARHKDREELSNNFMVATKRALEAYISVNNIAPVNVIVFRDGVGDGQIDYVKDQEVEGIKNCLKEMQLKTNLAFVIVSKRINTRIMGGNERQNPLPGTVVDDVITLPERYDFFLVSQSVNEGTVSPTSYNVIEDNTSLKPDHMQRIAYKLTHLYYNWQGTVRVPAPCLYAHKLAFITGQSIHEQPHEALSRKLWYL